MLVFHKIGNYNYEDYFYNNNIAKIVLPNLKQVYYEKNNEEKKTDNKIIFNKIHRVDSENSNLKILLIDFEYNSPYQKNFYYFCKKYLDNNPNINMMVIYKIGNYNNDDYFQNNNNAKIVLPSLTQIYYEKDNNDKNSGGVDVYNFIEKFFYINKFLKYEGLDDKNNINYLNLSFKNIQKMK